jgi:hypothetical protein
MFVRNCAFGGAMTTGAIPEGLELTEEEAFSLLGLCLTSPQALDATSEKALRKLAEFCISKGNHKSHYSPTIVSRTMQAQRELGKAGA